MHQTLLAARQSANGRLQGGLRRRNRRLTVRPSRSNSAPIVLAAGQLISGARRSSQARTFTGPQLRCARRTARHLAAIAASSACGWWCGDRDRSTRPNHTLGPVTREPFVAGLAADAELSTNRCKRLCRLFKQHHKAHPLVHGTGLHPSHRQGPPCRSLTCYPCRRFILLPMSPVCTGALPSPLWGGVGGGGRALLQCWRRTHHPPPQPSPARGEGADRDRGADIGNHGQCHLSTATTASGSGSSDVTMSVLSDRITAPTSDTTVPRITLPPNTSCCGLSMRLK